MGQPLLTKRLIVIGSWKNNQVKTHAGARRYY